MRYLEIWESYLKTREEHLGKAYSSHKDIRRAILNDRYVDLRLIKVEDVILSIGGGNNGINSLPQLMRESPYASDISISFNVRTINISRMVDGSLIVSLCPNKTLCDIDLKKELPEEIFEYLWVKTETAQSDLLTYFRIIPTSFNFTDNGGDASDLRTMTSTLGGMGYEFVKIPGSITDIDLMCIPFVFGDMILKAPIVKEYLVAFIKRTRNTRLQKLVDLL